jgi:hypothetical protein
VSIAASFYSGIQQRQPGLTSRLQKNREAKVFYLKDIK